MSEFKTPSFQSRERVWIAVIAVALIFIAMILYFNYSPAYFCPAFRYMQGPHVLYPNNFFTHQVPMPRAF